MWCANCHADVAAEVTADNKRIRCATCGGHIGTPQALRAAAKTRQAKELLERWSSHRVLDPYGPMPGVKSTVAPEADERKIDESSPAGPTQPAEASPPVASSSQPPEEVSAEAPPPAGQQDEPVRPQPESPPQPEPSPAEENRQTPSAVTGYEIHPGHSTTTSAPEFNVQDLLQNEDSRKASLVALMGQLLAYAGVLGLTIGMTLVIWGYFGDREQLAPTGWLITTVGQMLLFLGVVTLVSGGMEQTTAEVTRRIDKLGEKLLRIEHAAREHNPRGPSVPAEQFSPGVREAEPAGPAMRDPAGR